MSITTAPPVSEQAVELAREILEEARTSLTVQLRFLDHALWTMPLVAEEMIVTLGSDGEKIAYNPLFVIQRFREDPSEVVRDLLHDIFHCVFHHPFLHYQVDRALWDVACDISVEAALIDLVGGKFSSARDGDRKEVLASLQARVGILTAERIYHHFFDRDKAELYRHSLLFWRDAHEHWYKSPQEKGDEGEKQDSDQKIFTSDKGDDTSDGTSSSGDGTFPQDTQPHDEHDNTQQQSTKQSTEENTESTDEPNRSDETELPQETSETQPDENGFAQEGSSQQLPDEAEQTYERDEATEEEWQEISMKMQMELESRLHAWGDKAGSLIDALAAVNRDTYDYTDFLKRFSVLGERMQVNDDEFDYVFYTYGLELYGNMPLVEPLEYRETHSIRDFVIAIDTSGSCAGDLVKAFIRKTYSILKQEESFHSRVNIHIIQCDAEVQSDDKMTTLSDLDTFIKGMQIRGFGGTDFRPVFARVETLLAKREFTDLRGLIYFTDGKGTFPQKKPPYDVAFVFVDDGYSDPYVPSWAYKVVLDMNELTDDQRVR